MEVPRSEGCGFFWAGNGRWTSEHFLGAGFQVKLTELRLGLEGAEEVTSGDMGRVVMALGHWTGYAQSIRRSRVAVLLREVSRV